MEKREFIEALKELTEKENVLSTGREVNELRTQFEDYLIEATRQFQIAELEAKDKGEEFTEQDWMTPLKEEFYEIFSPYKEKRKAVIDAKRSEEEENLRKKRALINQLQSVISDEENIGAAFSAHKEINEKWKEVGDIPRDKRNDVQQEYSRLLEQFFYNMNIYKEIKDYDFKKNYETKKALIEQIKALLKVEKIKEVEASIKQLQNEWEDVGPTKQEQWEELKDEYYSTVNKIYDRIRSFYDDRREKMQANIAQKKELIQKMETILAQARTDVKAWSAQTKDVLALQKDWKGIGFGPKKENDEVWSTFRGLCDQFFDEKSDFYKDIQKEYDKVAEVKKALIAKVNELKESTDWGATTKAIIDLQKQWKRAGSAGQKNEQKLWKEFRGACDAFFDGKQAHFEEKDKAFEGNLKAKEELIEEISNCNLPENKEEAIAKINDFTERFNAIGFVPSKQKDNVFKSYKAAIDKLYASLNLEGEEKEKVMFEARIKTIQGSGNAAEMFEKEKQAIRNEMSNVKQEIIQFENNLGFFANSKGANALKEQVENNIKAEQEKLNSLKAKLKMIPNE
ncbi:DUF349 domain-containing protein [Brumimicrobium aurantiacum]|uniref:DUF349 domain-containing protein n=1 Tax=Brumimicrobium aurantiacum TaxID=1737063 RepID=A0A3E1F1M8_9FLAO|nr:DUF349 domain-containing protein [Brumimicrobium aurantiacum]RFC55716.1 DUF349 domain-containing protein [Brumimicrobium aurantiacum]